MIRLTLKKENDLQLLNTVGLGSIPIKKSNQFSEIFTHPLQDYSNIYNI